MFCDPHGLRARVIVADDQRPLIESNWRSVVDLEKCAGRSREKEKGNAGLHGTQAGDLYVRLSVMPDKHFIRAGGDILTTATIKLTDALLGTTIQIQTLDGLKDIEVSVGTRQGDQMRLKGLGVHGRSQGDQIVTLSVETPKRFSTKAKKLIEELAKEL